MKTLRILALLVASLFVAFPAFAGDKIIAFPAATSVPGSTDPAYLGATSITGPLALNESLGPELLTNGSFDADASWTKGTGWTIAAGVATHAGSAGTLTATGVATEVGKTYKLTFSISAADGGFIGAATTLVGSVAPSSTNLGTVGPYASYVSASTTGGLVIGALVTGTSISIDNVSLKEVLSTITTTSGPVVVAKTLADATANESALVVTGSQSGAAGDKSVIMANFVGTAGSGAEYLYVGKNAGTQTFEVSAAGSVASATGFYKGMGGVGVTLGPVNSLSGSAAGALTTVSGSSTKTGGAQTGLSVIETLNQASGTASNTMLHIAATETALGSGAQKLISANAGAAGTTERFSVSNLGIVTAGGGSASAGVCWKADGITLGYCSGGLGLVCGTCN